MRATRNFEKLVSGEFLAGVVYGAKIVSNQSDFDEANDFASYPNSTGRAAVAQKLK
jgi:hypothetical protein